MLTTSRLSLDVPQSTDAVNVYPADAAESLAVLDNAVLITQGTLASRPAASSVEAGHEYYATDTTQTYKSNGTAWFQIPTVNASTGVGMVLQTLTSQKLRVAYGTQNITFASGAYESGTYTIPHGLGAVPVFHVGYFNTNGSSSAASIVQNAASADNTNLYYYGWLSASAGSAFSLPCVWMALG